MFIIPFYTEGQRVQIYDEKYILIECLEVAMTYEEWRVDHNGEIKEIKIPHDHYCASS